MGSLSNFSQKATICVEYKRVIINIQSEILDYGFCSGIPFWPNLVAFLICFLTQKKSNQNPNMEATQSKEFITFPYLLKPHYTHPKPFLENEMKRKEEKERRGRDRDRD